MSNKTEIKVGNKKVVLTTKPKKESIDLRVSNIDEHIEFIYLELSSLREKLEKVLIRMGL